MTVVTENWVAVEGFPGYSVNPLGQVRKDSTGRVLQPRVNQYGVPYVGMMRNWKQHPRSLPRLVAKAFVPQPNDVWDTPINLNGDRLDCRVENLMWRPDWYARHYNRQFREPYENPINAPVRDIETDDEWPNSLSCSVCKWASRARSCALDPQSHADVAYLSTVRDCRLALQNTLFSRYWYACNSHHVIEGGNLSPTFFVFLP
jgi:hypothetical protein